MFRRMGLSQKIRAAGLRPHVPMDVYIILALSLPPLLRLSYPSVQQALADNRASSDGAVHSNPIS